MITTGKPSSSAACTASCTVVAWPALRHGHAVLREELLALVFEEVHQSVEWRAARGAGPYRKPFPMPLPKDVKFVTFDCYGTLIDWETGVYEAFQKEADRDGFTIDRDELIPRFIEVQREIQRGSYELYAEVLRRTAVRVAAELGWELEPSRSNFLPNSVPSWAPFRETNAQLERFAKKYEIGILSNIDDKLLGATRRHFRVDFDLVVTAQQVRSYKPDPAHFKECARRIEGQQEELGAHRERLSDRRRALPSSRRSR